VLLPCMRPRFQCSIFELILLQSYRLARRSRRGRFTPPPSPPAADDEEIVAHGSRDEEDIDAVRRRLRRYRDEEDGDDMEQAFDSYDVTERLDDAPYDVIATSSENVDVPCVDDHDEVITTSSKTIRLALNEWINDINDPSETKRQLMSLTQLLLDSDTTQDWRTFSTLCNSSTTCFEPGANGYRVSGLKYHKFRFDAVMGEGAEARSLRRRRRLRGGVEASVSSPHVRLLGDKAAVVSYVRSDVERDVNGRERVLARTEETRVWEVIDGKWVNVHFHRSGVPPPVEPERMDYLRDEYFPVGDGGYYY